MCMTLLNSCQIKSMFFLKVLVSPFAAKSNSRTINDFCRRVQLCSQEQVARQPWKSAIFIPPAQLLYSWDLHIQSCRVQDIDKLGNFFCSVSCDRMLESRCSWFRLTGPSLKVFGFSLRATGASSRFEKWTPLKVFGSSSPSRAVSQEDHEGQRCSALRHTCF